MEHLQRREVLSAMMVPVRRQAAERFSQAAALLPWALRQGAERLGWTLEELMEKTILAMRSCEERINQEMAQ